MNDHEPIAMPEIISWVPTIGVDDDGNYKIVRVPVKDLITIRSEPDHDSGVCRIIATMKLPGVVRLAKS